MPSLTRRFLTAFLFALVVAGALLSAPPARADGELTLQISGIDATNYPNVRLVVTAQTQDGRRIPDLQPSNFYVSSAGRQLPVASTASVTEDPVGISALLAIDASGSMAGAAITAARSAAQTFVDSLRPVDEVAVVSFANDVTLLTDFTTDLAAARAAIGTIPAVGNTALYQAVVDSSNGIAQRGAERKLVILLSDGADFGGVSRITRDQSLLAARDAGVPFYIIGFGSQIDRAYLQALQAATRGTIFYSPTSAQLQSTFSEIAVQVRAQYVVTLDVSKLGLEGEVPSRLRVQFGNQSGEADFQFTAPQRRIPQEVQLPVSEGGGAPAWLLAIFPVLALLLALTYLGPRLSRVLRGRRRPADAPAPVFRRETESVPARASAGEVRLKLVSGDGAEFAVADELVTVGTSAADTYRLPSEAGEVWAGNLRIWPANGRVIIHDTSARPRLKLNGKGATWAFLSHGDEIEIGSQRLRVSFLHAGT